MLSGNEQHVSCRHHGGSCTEIVRHPDKGFGQGSRVIPNLGHGHLLYGNRTRPTTAPEATPRLTGWARHRLRWRAGPGESRQGCRFREGNSATDRSGSFRCCDYDVLSEEPTLPRRVLRDRHTGSPVLNPSSRDLRGWRAAWRAPEYKLVNM